MAMTKADIINEINRLTAELPTRKKVASTAEHEGLQKKQDENNESSEDEEDEGDE